MEWGCRTLANRRWTTVSSIRIWLIYVENHLACNYVNTHCTPTPTHPLIGVCCALHFSLCFSFCFRYNEGSSHATGAGALKTGWFVKEKQGHFKKARRRFCELHATMIKYYEDEDGKSRGVPDTEKGFIQLMTSTVCTSIDRKLLLTNPNKHWTLVRAKREMPLPFPLVECLFKSGFFFSFDVDYNCNKRVKL